MGKTTRETLQKQLQLLSERSKDSMADLLGLTHAMCEVAKLLPSGFIPEDSDEVCSKDAKCSCSN